MNSKKQIEAVLDLEKKEHPKAKIEDYYKLVFQSIFGPGHLVRDKDQTLRYLEEEWESVSPDSSCHLVQDISINMAVFRLSLQNCKANQIPLDLIADVFFEGSKCFQNPLQADFPKILHVLSCILIKSDFGFLSEDVNQILPMELSDNFPIMHHSKVYRELYQPHYRVIPASLFYARIA